MAADPNRVPWAQEPRCDSCHTRAGFQFEQPGTLFRNSVGHGNVHCAACHGSKTARRETDAGTRYVGQLKPQGSGTEPAPIMIEKFGEGAAPRIDAEGKYLDALLLRNVEFWEVQDLELTNLGTNREPWRTGVRVVTDGFGAMRHMRLRNLFVHDVNGDLDKSREGCGIYFESRGANQSHFDGLVIENCRVVRTDRNGICQRTSGRARSVNVVIRSNLLEDIGGDGIKIWGSNGARVEHKRRRRGEKGLL